MSICAVRSWASVLHRGVPDQPLCHRTSVSAQAPFAGHFTGGSYGNPQVKRELRERAGA